MKENDIEGEDEMGFKPLLFVLKEDLPNTTSEWKISEALKQHYGNAANGNQFFDVIEMKKAFSISSPTLKVAKEIYQKGFCRFPQMEVVNYIVSRESSTFTNIRNGRKTT